MSEISTLKQKAKANLKGNYGTSILGGVISGILTGLASIIPCGGLVVGGTFSVGQQRIYNKAYDGEKPEVGDLFCAFSENFGETFLMGLLKGIFLLLWTMLFVIPGIIKSCSYAMTAYLMDRNKDLSATDAIRTSRELMDGHKWDLFVLDLSFFGWFLLVVLTLGIAALYVMPYFKATRTAFFNEIYKQ